MYAGQLEEAFWIFTKIVDEDPENGFAFLNRGFVLHRRDKLQLAESDLNQVRERGEQRGALCVDSRCELMRRCVCV